jgi:general secretion pathway protein J
MKPPGRAEGFTLVEVVIAVSIVGALLAIVVGGLRVGLAAWRQGDARADTLQRSRSLTQLIIRTLAGTHPYREGAIGPTASGIVFEGAPDRLAFVTATPPLPDPVPIAFTAVTLAGEAEGLTMRQRPLPAHEPFELGPAALTDPAVVAVRFRYRRAEDAPWQNRWNGALEKALPGAVEIALTTEQNGRRVEHRPVVVVLRALTP